MVLLSDTKLKEENQSHLETIMFTECPKVNTLKKLIKLIYRNICIMCQKEEERFTFSNLAPFLCFSLLDLLWKKRGIHHHDFPTALLFLPGILLKNKKAPHSFK